MLFSRDSAGASDCLSVVRDRSSRGAGVVVCGLFILITGVQSSAQVQFTDVTASSGITFMNHHEMMIAGVIAADITGDGYPEIFFNDEAGFNNELYINNGDGTFTEAGAAWGVRVPYETASALFLDWDNDGLNDLVMITSIGPNVGEVRLLRNMGDHFEAFGRSDAMVVRPFVGKHMTAFDYDGDGYLDLITSGGRCEGLDDQNLVMRNNKRGSFDIIRPFVAQTTGCSPWQEVAADLNEDGLMDVFTARDSGTLSRVYLQQVDGQMLDSGGDLGITDGPDMGVSITDYDMDGDQDIYVTDISTPNSGRNRLFQNQLIDTGVLGFVNVANQIGVANTGVGWGSSFFDYDNDGYLDLAVASMNEVSRLFHNRGDGTYEKVGEQIGFAPVGNAEGLITLDYDLDGDLDIVIANQMGNAQIYRNDGGDVAGGWIKVNLVDHSGDNVHGVGAKVRIVAGNRVLYHQTKTGMSYNSQEPYLLHFGLGAGVGQCNVEVEWPDGEVTVIESAPAEEVLTVVRGARTHFRK